MSLVLVIAGCGRPSPTDTPSPSSVADSGPSSSSGGGTVEIGLSPAYGDTLIESYIADAVVLNPVLLCDVPSRQVVSLIFNGLVREGGYLKLTADLAATWEVLDSGREILFHLRDGVRWHDGHPFSAEDVVFTWQKIMDPATVGYERCNFSSVETMEIIDPLTVRVKYGKPFAPALYCWTIGIIPAHIFRGETDINTSRYNRAPVGTGPFRFANWAPHEQIILEANEDYFNGRPYFSRYIYRVIPDPSMAFLSLTRGDIDLVELTPDQYVKQASSKEFLSRFNVFRCNSRLYTYLGFNLINPLFQDPNIRLALTMATDRKRIIDEILYGFGAPLTGPFPPSFWAYNQEIEPYPYDPEKARQLLKKSGWTDSDGDGVLDRDGHRLEFRLSTNNGNEMRRLASTLIRDLWAEIGVRVILDFVEWSVLMDLCDYKSFDALILGWSNDGDPDPFARFHSSEIPDKAAGKVADNFCSYVNPEADELLESGRTSFDFEKRKEIYHRFHSIVHQDMPYIFLFSQNRLIAVHNRIHGINVAPSGIRWNLEKWYTPQQMQKY
ncbi:MAG: peptide-binding protein [Candidatus Wallbacteria bacterium]|nr:peptide-binding protein [Candidatus Wallbacteria bacterium]